MIRIFSKVLVQIINAAVKEIYSAKYSPKGRSAIMMYKDANHAVERSNAKQALFQLYPFLFFFFFFAPFF
jgi:hypothetical protein